MIGEGQPLSERSTKERCWQDVARWQGKEGLIAVDALGISVWSWGRAGGRARESAPDGRSFKGGQEEMMGG